jgi:hypothetical protein
LAGAVTVTEPDVRPNACKVNDSADEVVPVNAANAGTVVGFTEIVGGGVHLNAKPLGGIIELVCLHVADVVPPAVVADQLDVVVLLLYAVVPVLLIPT